MDETSGLTCRELVELVTEYLEDTLPPAGRERFEHHLSDCDACRIHLEQMRRTIQLTGALSEETIPAAARDELLRAFRTWKQG